MNVRDGTKTMVRGEDDRRYVLIELKTILLKIILKIRIINS